MKLRLKIYVAALCCLLSIGVDADEFQQYRDALKKASEPFEHYSAKIHIVRHKKTPTDPAMRLVGEATCAFEIQQIMDPKEVMHLWLRDVAESVDFSAGAAAPPTVSVATTVRVPWLGTYKLEDIRVAGSQPRITGYIDDFMSLKYESEYPHALGGIHFLNFPIPEGLSFQFSHPDEEYKGLPGMRMDFRGIHTTVWFSPEHDYFPVCCRRILGKESDMLMTFRVLELGTQEYRGSIVYYPKTYECETVRLPSNYRTLFSVEVLSIEFRELDREFQPTVTFPAGIRVYDWRPQNWYDLYVHFVRDPHSYTTSVSQTHPQEIPYFLFIACICGIALGLALVWAVYRWYRTRHDDL